MSVFFKGNWGLSAPGANKLDCIRLDKRRVCEELHGE
jgi:hypothetical protein